MLAGSLWWVLMGHINTLDMGFAFFLQASLAGFLIAQTAGKKSLRERNAMLFAWAAAALAVLSNVLAGLVLPGMVLVAYCLLMRCPRTELRRPSATYCQYHHQEHLQFPRSEEKKHLR